MPSPRKKKNYLPADWPTHDKDCRCCKHRDLFVVRQVTVDLIAGEEVGILYKAINFLFYLQKNRASNVVKTMSLVKIINY
jgi:hypothetical protein